MARFLITSALPYVNGVKHLGNLAGSLLPADIHARFRRQTGHEVLFLCGTDEHGTPSELAAQAAGVPVAEYCARQHARQADIYRRFGLSFDHFSRTSGLANRLLTQELFRHLDAAGHIEPRLIRQAYSATDRRFLPDRYVVGTCPHCGSPNARGDQCESCTRLLDPGDLASPRSAISGATDVEFRETRHLFLKLSGFEGQLRRWIETRRDWPPLVRSIATKWLDEGLKDRCITRDLTWGVPVPKPGFEDKVFYVWFDAPIGYIAAAIEWSAASPGRDWRAWWQGGDGVHYVQFLAKDNVPFHTISFPATILGSGLPLKLPDIIKGFNWLTFEGGKFSTSSQRGIFTDTALTLLPADSWRWWLAANAPENADADFTVERFVDGVNKDLADTFGNLVNRCLAFAAARFELDGSGRWRCRSGRGQARRGARGAPEAVARASRGIGPSQGGRGGPLDLAACKRLSRRCRTVDRHQARSRTGRRNREHGHQSGAGRRVGRLAVHSIGRGRGLAKSGRGPGAGAMGRERQGSALGDPGGTAIFCSVLAVPEGCRRRPG